MAVELTFEMRPDFRLVARQIDAMANQLAYMIVPLETAANIAAMDAARRFDEEGPGWADWVLGYQHPEGHGTIGDLSGEMVAHASDPGSYEITPHSVSYQFQDEKESAFQFGNSRQASRPFIGLSPEGEDLVELAFAVWLDEILSGGGLYTGPHISFHGGAWRNQLGQFAKRPPGSSI